MAFTEITEALVESLGVRLGDDGSDFATTTEAEEYEKWAIAQVNEDFPSDLDSDLRKLVISLLVCHYADIKLRIPATETSEDGYIRVKGGALGETQYGQNYKEKVAKFSDGDMSFPEMRDEYIGRS